MLPLLLALTLGGCATSAPPTAVPLRPSAPLPPELLADRGAAPELSNPLWLNAAAPVTLEGLRGQVVLLTFWTFG